jgi:Ca2+-binding RTX toxin-like protein
LVDVGGGVNLHLRGDAGDDRLTGGTDASGGEGDDTLVGNGRSQVLAGGPGDDSIDGGAGADSIDAGPGNDTVEGDGPAVRGAPVPAGEDTILGGDGRDVLRGGPGRDTINGEGGNDTIEGGTVGDVLEGGTGNDWLEGQAGGDRVSGGSGDDHVRGNDGIDRLEGGPGRDTILPGNQADVVDAIDGERDILQCAQSPAVVDGPFLADEIDISTYCRSLVYDFGLTRWVAAAHDQGFCVRSAARTSATLIYTYRSGMIPIGGPTFLTPWEHLREVSVHGSTGNLDRHSFISNQLAPSMAGETLVYDVEMTAWREGLPATHGKRLLVKRVTPYDDSC